MDPPLQPPPKPTSRGPSGKSTLETVQENSSDAISESPAAVQATRDLRPLTLIHEDDDTSARKDGAETEKHTQLGESGNESTGNKSDTNRGRRASVSSTAPKTAAPVSRTLTSSSSKGGYGALSSTKSRQGEGKQNMTVETETVVSIPQSALGTGDRSGSNRMDANGSLRLRPSNETIRPKKERKKPSLKARSINQGTGMSYDPRSNFPFACDSVEYDTSCDDDDVSIPSSTHSSVRTVRRTPRRTVSYSQRWQRAVSLRRPTHYIQILADMYLRKASSKADIFEARVASAVEEAHTSDSDETFVYESNPPEPQRRPRHHSRTPSVTSSHSTADQQRAGVRSFGEMLDERRVAGKRSMKFSNNPYNHEDSPDSKNGTVRSHQPRHYGKAGRGGTHASMFDQDSPFTQASKLRGNHLLSRSSRPNSPRSPQSVVQQNRPSALFSNGRKQETSFDFDGDGEGADDERTPLVGSMRTRGSGRTHRRGNSDNARSIDEYYGVRARSRCSRFGGCMMGLCVLIAVVLTAVAFLIMSNRPLYDVRISEIKNVLASEQEIMLDLLVGAVNPNALGISVANMDVNVFAKSKYLGPSESWDSPNGFKEIETVDKRRRQRRRVLPDLARSERTRYWHKPSHGGVDEGTDPPDDLEKDAQTMLLGRIFHFDQGLSFEGSPIKRHHHYSTGEIRLAKPGNRTEAGGSAKWEKILQHPFELIVRGVLQYELPISSRPQNAIVGASVLVHPEDGVDGKGTMRLEKPKRLLWFPQEIKAEIQDKDEAISTD